MEPEEAGGGVSEVQEELVMRMSCLSREKGLVVGRETGFDELTLNEVIAKGSLDFDMWTSLISQIEKTYPDDIEKICLVYDSFLSEFPLCYGYWRKYADHKTQLCTVDKVIEVFERAVRSATYSVGVWVDYCSFSMSVFEDPYDVRRLFKEGYPLLERITYAIHCGINTLNLSFLSSSGVP
ncbi:hypothetical protein L1049_010623 [Liquidambar formosana]|uniref:Pre-mRNA-processing factor 39 n=1 Tax=Liquidambar formosana TaxID=63359 RepID=A0AAP0N9I4_LIQFO